MELGPQHRPDLYRSRNAFQVPCPQVLKLEEIPEKPSCVFADNDHVGLGDALEAGREVRRLADDARGQIADYDYAGRDTDPEPLGNTRFEACDRRDEL